MTGDSARMISKILVFDGVCILCSRWTQFVLRRDRHKQFRFAAMQSERGRPLMIQHGINPEGPMSLLLLEGERAYTDSEAIIRVLRSLGGVWKMLALAIRIVPLFARDPLYRSVARHRYRIFGKREVCFIPTPEVADRFLS